MKQITTLFLLSALLLFTACESEPAVTLISASDIEAGVDGGSATVSFTANRDWRVNCSSWIHASPSSGTKTGGTIQVSVTFDANPTYDERSGSITITIEGMSQSVKVRQPAKDGLVVPTRSFEIEAAAQSLEIEVQSNVNYDVSCSASWIRYSATKALTSKTLVFSVEENTSPEAREAIITIKAGGSKVDDQVVSVTQKGKPQEEDIEPGLFGLSGLKWTYRPGVDQMLFRKSGQKCYAMLIDPATNTIFNLEIPAKSAYTQGMELAGKIIQNVDKTRPAVIDVKLKVSRQEGRYLWLADANGNTAVFTIK